MWEVIRHLRGHTRALLATFLAATVARLLMLADPQILRLIVDRYVLRAGVLPRPEFVRGFLGLIGVSVVVGLLARLFRTAQEYEIAVIARRVGAKLYAGSLAHSLLLPYREFEDRRSAEILNVIQRARQEAETGVGGAVRLYLGALAVVAVSAYAYTVHPLLGILHVVLLPAVAAALLFLSRPIRMRQRQIALQAAALGGSSVETIRNIELVKGLGVEIQEASRLDEVNRRILGLEEAKLRVVRRLTLLEGVLFHGLRATLLGAMAWLLYDRAITTGEFLSLFLYTSVIFTPLLEAEAALVRYQEARASFDTLDGILERPPEARAKNAPAVGPISTITLSGVSLWHPGAQAAAVRDVHLELGAGRTIALTGPSGAGKSSLVKILVGLYTPTAGTLLINGRDLREIDLDSFRARLGLVTQETQLFSGTIRDNLQIACADASDERCWRALDQAEATSIPARGGQGLDTRVGESGLTLSGGERQRLAIARALLRDPDVLVFDEATSDLDALTEQAVASTIRHLAGARRLTLVVSHRLSTITHADCIHVLDHGAICESGTHDELCRRDGLYAALWRQQGGASGERAQEA